MSYIKYIGLLLVQINLGSNQGFINCIMETDEKGFFSGVFGTVLFYVPICYE